MQFEEIDTSSFSFTEPKYEDTISAALEEKYPDYADVIQKIKAVYDWSVLVEIMAGEDYLSFAKVNAYNKHKENLCILKEVIRKYCDSEMYHKFLMASMKRMVMEIILVLFIKMDIAMR